MINLSQLGEREIIRRYVLPLLSTDMGNALLDDCAVIHLDSHSPPYLFSVDQGPGRTFLDLLGVGTPADIAHFHVTINVSDIAAMGGEPLALLLVFTARPDDPEEYVKSYFAGVEDALAEYRVQLIGGDTKQSSSRSTTITIFGRAMPTGPLLRKGAKIGDQIFVTDEPIGQTLASYIAVARARKFKSSPHLPGIIRAKAKVEFGQRLARSGICTSCMDMSDGLLASAEQLADINGVSFKIIPNMIPLAPAPDPNQDVRWRDLALNVGGDFGLMFTTTARHAEVAQQMGARLVGEVVPRQSTSLDLAPLERAGILQRSWEQFRTVDPISAEILSLV